MSEPADSRQEAHAALVAKVDAFHTEVEGRRGADLACRRGCDACCRVRLSVSAVEAAAIERHIATLDETVRRRLKERVHVAEQDRTTESSPDEPPRCIMLEDDGACAVYAVRPLVCRTQGLPLRYPPRTFPEDAVMAKGADGSDIVWCPLNFKDAPPKGPDVLEAGRLDEMLVLINLEHVGGDREAALKRVSLEMLVEQMSTT